MPLPPPLSRESLSRDQAEAARRTFDAAMRGEPGLDRAVRSWQRNLGVTADGEVGPLTRARFDELAARHAPDLRYAQPTGEPPWYDLAERYLGLHEQRDNRALADFLRSDGHYLGDPAELPWCGDFVQTCLALTLPHEPLPGRGLPGSPYVARHWRHLGRETEPTVGAIAVFWRGSPTGTAGHVAFVAGRGPGTLYVLGGNQSNSVSVAPISRERLIACRWPETHPAPTVGTLHLPTLAGGRLSTNES